jgi:N-acetylmuramoyl-L-alanine amidase
MQTKLSPNHGKGRGGRKPEIVVIHIMEGSLEGTTSWFMNIPKYSGVSAHYGIGKAGEVVQYVKEEDTAWHSGVVDRPSFKLYKEGVNPNLYSIGIEHAGRHTEPWTKEMKEASGKLIGEICRRWDIPIDRDHIIGHYEVRASKPNCPSVDKGVIDELIDIAKGHECACNVIGNIEEVLEKIEEIKRLLTNKK